jgi:hypothetical protein
MPEPPDHHEYSWISLYGDTLTFFLEGVKFYQRLLEENANALTTDPDIRLILPDEILDSLPLHKELQRVRRVRMWLEQQIGEEAASAGFVPLTHGTVRFLKSTSILFLQKLKHRRNLIASRPNISRYALEALDTRISVLEEKTTIGVFGQATPMPLLVDQAVPPEVSSSTGTEPGLESVSRPRPVVIGSIELLDAELRARCLDLFAAFRSDGNTDRLDTVLSEASRILENRIRSAAHLPVDCVGLELTGRAFAGTAPRLRLSNVPAEQEAAHLLYRGVFGFVRNHVQHQLVGGLLPERVLQILGLIDYLLFLVEDAVRSMPVTES